MNQTSRVAVCSRSFSRHPMLREELLQRYSQVTFNDSGKQFAGDELVEFLRGHDKAITALETIDEYVLSRVPELKAIGKYGVGLDMLEFSALRRHGVRLGWTPGVNRRSVSELVIAMAIAMLRRLPQANQEARSGIWRQHVGGLLSGRTVGIVGLGNIGKDMTTLLKPFGCRVLAHDILEFPAFCAEYGICQTGLDELLAESDLVTIHLPLDASTRGMFSAEVLGRMKPGAYLVNAARGGIVDEAALKACLASGALAGAGFDVLLREPPEDMELLNMPSFYVTPHLGGSSEEAILAMGRAAIDGLDGADILADTGFKY